MRARYKLKMTSADDVERFCNTIQKFEGDININIDSTTYDAKSLIVVQVLSTGREVEIELVTDRNQLKEFDEFIKSFR